MHLRTWRVDATIPVLVVGTVIATYAAVAAWAVRGELETVEVAHLAVFAVAIAFGNIARLNIVTGRETTPLSTAAGLGLSMSVLSTQSQQPIGAAVVITTTVAGILVGRALMAVNGRASSWSATAALVVGGAVAPILYRSVPFAGKTLLEWQETWEDQRWLVALVMLLVGSVAMVVDLTVEAAIRASVDQSPLLSTVVDELRSAAALSTALVASGALIALAEFAIGVAALPLFLFPLVLTYFAVQRHASIRMTYRQTIGALSTLTDLAGYTATNHAMRVAETSVAVGRDLGMGQRELTDLEYAALLHDLGQVALREPIPAGATVMAAPSDQQRIAQNGAEIARSTGVLDNVATIMEAQTTPYRQVREFNQQIPMASRIIKVANAYDDLSGPDNVYAERAMERIHLGLGYEYDPRVVDSLTRYLDRRRRSSQPSV